MTEPIAIFIQPVDSGRALIQLSDLTAAVSQASKQGEDHAIQRILSLLRQGKQNADWPGGQDSMSGPAWADWLEKKLQVQQGE